MTDDERLKKLDDRAQDSWHGLITIDTYDLAFLVALARIGAAVKPRQISEAPKYKNQELLQFSDPSLDVNVHGSPRVDIGRKIAHWAHTFIPISVLSALPPPEQ